MIEFRVAQAIKPGDVILLPWPDWMWRRHTVVRVRTSSRHDYTQITVRPTEGDDLEIQLTLLRYNSEIMHVLSERHVKVGNDAENGHRVSTNGTFQCPWCMARTPTEKGMNIHVGRVHKRLA
jgi:hypothetical protein